MHLSPGFNNEPLKVPAKNNLVRAPNPRSYLYTAINSAGTLTRFTPNAAYSITGSEVYLNSGWLLPPRKDKNKNFLDFQVHSPLFIKKLEHITTLWMQGSVIAK
jgi:hypothetical protein